MNITTTPMYSMLGTLGWPFVSQIGVAFALALAAFGSAVGIGLAGRAAAGAWAKEAKAGQTLRFTYIILLGLPLSQTLYAMIVMNKLGAVLKDHADVAVANVGLMLGIGLAVGMAEMMSAWMQGLIGAAGIRAISEGEGKGFPFIIIAMGIVETVGIFAMVFLMGLVPKAA
ncbi:hypothetical protein LCGC14_0454480 [marine sediment metagenome]|uniref:V-ATPase proteolipid subunit C-like domain-containing protein n=1 Tax=marine sediment metagenome TaxID=412755 RepID=A0A0F9SGU8_9ZZZZ|nr:V-type ATP synthase subunit K [Phycisphaerae bacterium]HDZ45284.1 V-type ATP synthase subunit K [Phycisphaerae bacterium]